MSEIFAEPEVIQAAATVVGVFTGMAIIYVLTLWSLAKGAQYWRVVKGAVPSVRAAVDEPSDAANVAIDRVLDRFYVAQWENMAAVFLPKFLDEVAKIVDAKLETPPQEVNVPYTPPTAEMVKAVMGQREDTAA